MRLRVMSTKPLQLHQLLHFLRMTQQQRANRPAISLQLQQPPHQVRRMLMPLLLKMVSTNPLRRLLQYPHQPTTWTVRLMSLGRQ
ncbi:hypothetical protein C6Q18_22790 [Pseudomonas chlororaphis subsp. piscium]|nr:hypothetical protein C6Q18_22790 [Pseudomonas chlororaphis subsp. piscium]